MSIVNETDSKAEQLLQQIGVDYHSSGVDQSVVQTCPLCHNVNGKFYINTSGGDKDGLWGCKVCGKEGNLYQLKEKLGIRTQNITSTKDVADNAKSIPPIIDWKAAHNRLMEDENYSDVMDYLLIERGLSMSVIEQFNLGAEDRHDSKWLVIPYFGPDDKTCIYTKHRNVTPKNKDDKFYSSPGREVPLFNENILSGINTVVCVEGEADLLALVSFGYTNVVGIPGANTKKAIWIDKLDKIENVYLLYDNDEVGQKAARDMASRIGIDKVKNIRLEPFLKRDGKPGKDINELILSGLTLDGFNDLVVNAKQFDVEGIFNLSSVVKELCLDLDEKGSEPTLKTPWPALTKVLGGAEWGDVIGIIAEGKVGKSSTALNWLQYYVEQGYNSLFYCQEMLPKRLVRKWVSMVTKTDDTPGKSQITSNTVRQAFEQSRQFSGEMLFGYTKVIKPTDIFDTIRQAVRRYGVKIVCFDNLNLMVRSLEHSVQEISKYTKLFKELAMELNILIILIIQPNRVAEGSLVQARNANGSSAIEKDVDAMVCLNRRRTISLKQTDLTHVIETNETFEPYLYANVDLCRYGTGGYCTLYFEGGTSTVRELCNSETSSLESSVTNGLIQTEMVEA